MSTLTLAVILRPVAYPILFFVVVAPIIWVLSRLIPEGKLKVFLFKVRSGPSATRRDKWIMASAVLLFYVLLLAVGLLSQA